MINKIKYTALWPGVDFGEIEDVTGLYFMGKDTSGLRPDHKPKAIIWWRENGKRRQRTFDLTQYQIYT